MDDFERRVLRKRKSSFAEHVKLDQDFLNTIRRTNLITDEHVTAVKAEKNVEHRASHFIDHVMAARVPNGFDVFTNVLMTDYAWLAKELQADLKAERGSLEIDEAVMTEAGMLVHRKFGTSKRIAEMDKKEMQELIAIKIQISKEEFKEEIGVLQQEIHRLGAIIDEYEKKARDTDSFLSKFMKDNESRLMSLAAGNKSTSDCLRTSDDDMDALAILNTHVKTIVGRTKIVVEERDLLYEDREKCLALLGPPSSSDESSMNMLHELIRERNKSKPNEATKLREELAEKEKLIQRLRKISSEYEVENDGNEAKVKGIKKDLEVKVKENEALKAQVKQMEKQMSEKCATPAATTPVGNGSSSKSKGRRGSKP